MIRRRIPVESMLCVRRRPKVPPKRGAVPTPLRLLNGDIAKFYRFKVSSIPLSLSGCGPSARAPSDCSS
jgi:hypothetical protein